MSSEEGAPLPEELMDELEGMCNDFCNDGPVSLEELELVARHFLRIFIL